MARIVRRRTPGTPGFRRGVTPGNAGARVSGVTQGSSFGGVRRLFQRNPADGNVANIGTKRDIPILGKVKGAIAATLTTALAGANNDLKYTAKVEGTVGNATTVRYVVAGANTVLSVAVVGAAITVNSATSGASAATSTAADVLAAVQASAAASALVKVENAAGNDGTGVITALAATNLAGGAQAVTSAEGDLNTTGAPRPGVRRAPSFIKGNATPTGQTKVVSRSNRRIRRSKNN